MKDVQRAFEKLIVGQSIDPDIIKVFNDLLVTPKITTGASMAAALTKSMHLQRESIASSLEAFSIAQKSIRSQLEIPESAIKAALSIEMHHESLASNFRVIIESLNLEERSQLWGRSAEIQSAIKNAASQIASQSKNQALWDHLHQYEEKVQRAVTLSEDIIRDREIYEQGTVEVDNSHIVKKGAINKDFFLWLGLLLTFINEVRHWLPSPEYATKEEIETLFTELFTHLEQSRTDNRTVNRNLLVYIKPKAKTVVVEKLPSGLQVDVLQVNHKWVFILYTSPSSNLPQAGWVKKKYLDKPKEE